MERHYDESIRFPVDVMHGMREVGIRKRNFVLPLAMKEVYCFQKQPLENVRISIYEKSNIA